MVSAAVENKAKFKLTTDEVLKNVITEDLRFNNGHCQYIDTVCLCTETVCPCTEYITSGNSYCDLYTE